MKKIFFYTVTLSVMALTAVFTFILVSSTENSLLMENVAAMAKGEDPYYLVVSKTLDGPEPPTMFVNWGKDGLNGCYDVFACHNGITGCYISGGDGGGNL